MHPYVVAHGPWMDDGRYKPFFKAKTRLALFAHSFGVLLPMWTAKSHGTFFIKASGRKGLN
jgi:hypothetical protein